MTTQEKVALFISNPTEENFRKIQGEALSFFLIYKKLEDKQALLKYFTISEWRWVCEETFGELAALAVEKLSAREKNFKEWCKVYDDQENSDMERKLAIKKMAETAITFDDCESVARVARDNKKIRKVAVKKMADLASSFEQWKDVFNFADGEIEALAIQKMGTFNKTFNEWRILYEDEPISLEKLCISKMFELANTFEEWLELHVIHLADNVLSDEEKLIPMQKMCELGTFEKWKWGFHETTNQAFKTVIAEKMVEFV